MSGVKGEWMDRGSEVMKARLGGAEVMEMRRCQEIKYCDVKTEFHYFIGQQHVAHSPDDTDCCCRFFCTSIHPFKMNIKELNTEASLLELDRPLKCNAGGCKCCCYQEESITSNGEVMGSIKETCYYCVPEFHIFDHTGKGLYKLHPPTCCGGYCVEGSWCVEGICWAVPFQIFPFEMTNTNGDQPFGKIRLTKSNYANGDEPAGKILLTECTFPNNSTPAQKATIVGSALLINAIYFEEGGCCEICKCLHRTCTPICKCLCIFYR